MKSSFIKIICALAMVATLSASAAQQKIATINLKKLFENYYKYEQANKNLKDLTADMNREKEALKQKLDAANDEYKKLVESAQDQAVSGEEREKRNKAAEDKKIDIRQIEVAADTFVRNASANLAEQQRRMTDNIVKELRDTINNKAKGLGYTLVLDTSGDTANSVPAVLYASGDDDLTEAMLTELNSKAPADSKPAAATDKKDDAKTPAK